VRRPVVLNHDGVLNRNIGSQSLEIVVDRISPVVHHLTHEHVCLPYSPSRLIDEATLSCPPALQILIASRRIQRANLKLLVALATLEQFLLPSALIPAFGYYAVVLRAESGLELTRAPLTREEHSDHDQEHNYNGHQDPNHRVLLVLS